MTPTYNQLINGSRITKEYHINRTSKGFSGAPQRKGIIYKIVTISPRKPNSARRTIAKVRLVFNDKKVFAKIPGIGEHKLQNHALVFLRGHGPKDSPGINYHLIRGKCDFHVKEEYGRSNRRSKFGLKKQKAK